MTDNAATTVRSAASGKPWGARTTIAWVVATLGVRRAVSFGLIHSPVGVNLHTLLGHVLNFISFATASIVLVMAVALDRFVIASYFAWNVPRLADVTLAVAAAPAPIVSGFKAEAAGKDGA